MDYNDNKKFKGWLKMEDYDKILKHLAIIEGLVIAIIFLIPIDLLILS